VYQEKEILQTGTGLRRDKWFHIAGHLPRVIRLFCAIENKLSFEEVIQLVIDLERERGVYTAKHQRRVTQLAETIANEMGVSEKEAKGISVAASIHDVGKLPIPEELLLEPFQKDDSLDEQEWDRLKAHPQIGYNILKEVVFPWPVAEIVYQHHEKINGSGYPRGLSGEEILLEARILTVADVVEAMLSHRPYRPEEKTPGLEKALETISENRGILYDLDVVDICLRLFEEKGFEFESGEG